MSAAGWQPEFSAELGLDLFASAPSSVGGAIGGGGRRSPRCRVVQVTQSAPARSPRVSARAAAVPQAAGRRVESCRTSTSTSWASCRRPPHRQRARGAKAALPFDDERDFEEARRGFLAAPPYRQIMAEAGHVAWNMGSYDFLLSGEEFTSIHPSLQRQAVLNMEYGLFEVVPGHIYQVRGFDLANISFIRSDTGWIVFDPLTASETAAAALALVNEHLGERPVVAVIYSHSHGDHFAGVHGVVDEADVRSGKVPGNRTRRVPRARRRRERLRR